ncbi:DUF885 domain-containing protein [Cutibacterium modestum]|uniref:DUF885 domain-containing protein n=1 Tax=Cutibacterium modestum TaxID=2559073 RepID=UPI0020A33FB1|nr:DUF885 domain-containing protein [Cutibacterium modestum]
MGSEVDEAADRYWDALVQSSPMLATALGLDLNQDEYDDLSPDGLDAQYRLTMDALDRLDQAMPADGTDQITVAAMRSNLGLEAESHDKGYDLLSLNGIASGAHAIREVYDAMPAETPAQVSTIAHRLHATGPALDGWLESQRAAVDAGTLPAIRQVDLLVEQITAWASDGGFFDDYLKRTASRDLPDAVKTALAEGIDAAKANFRHAAETLSSEIAPLATTTDAVGLDRYRLASRQFVGATVDLAETYEWGKQELARIEQLQRETAERIRPGAGIKEVMAILDADPAYQITGTEALKAWMQERADEAISSLDCAHFEVPAQARRIEVMIAPTHDGGVYYTPPSDDFSRPGRMWWSAPDGVNTFTTWRELTTVYHEGAPGHHLQTSSAIAARDELNSWRRNYWTSGYGEGWALYAEWLMTDLGYMDDPGHFMGLLDGQSMRAARVVLDIGLHCQFEAPDEVGGGEWNWDKAWTFFNNHVLMEEGSARFEVNRYFGWPGQAPSYKLGERTWLELREAAKATDPNFDLKEFHTKVLRMGALPLDVLRQAVLS